MAFTTYLAGRVFEPDQTEAMGEAFAMLCDLLSLNGHKRDPATIRVAEAVIEAAADGGADTEAIMQGAMQILGIGKGED